MASSLDEIEKKIRDLEQQVNSSVKDDAFEESDDGEVEHEGRESGSEELEASADLGRRKRRKTVEESSDEEEDEKELEPIPPLPKSLVPPAGLTLSAAARKREVERIEMNVTGKRKKIECKPCSQVYFNEEAYKKHTRTLKHRQSVILKAGAAYEPANHEANFCRACTIKFEEPEQLLLHRNTVEHKEAVQNLAKASYCFVCKKQFTSPVQLREHLKGKQHNDAVEMKTGYRPVKVFQSKGRRKDNE